MQKIERAEGPYEKAETKIIEHIEGSYESLEVLYGVVYKWYRGAC